MKNAFKALTSLLLVAALSFSLTMPALAANAPGKIDYVAFGDSVAAGVRGGVGVPGSESGSDKGYTDAIAAKLSAAGLLGSFSGDFCTSGITARLLAQDTAVLRDASTDAAKSIKDAELVTLNIGANDLLAPFYAYIATLESVGDIDPVQVKAVLAGIVGSLYQGTAGKEIQADIETILHNILTANSSVNIFVMGYYNPLPILSAFYGADLNEPVKSFNTFIRRAVENVLAKYPSASVTYVSTFEAMAASASALAVTDIHPTQAGYQIIAGEFWKSIEPLLSAYTQTATPSTAAIVVNGTAVDFDAYNISGSNYVKLRDVAMALRGTPKKFSVAWNGATNGVVITSGGDYTPVGGELAPAPNKTETAARLSPCSFTLNGVRLSPTVYLIHNNNYVKLRDLAKAFNFDVTFAERTNTITIDVTKGYSAP